MNILVLRANYVMQALIVLRQPAADGVLSLSAFCRRFHGHRPTTVPYGEPQLAFPFDSMRTLDPILERGVMRLSTPENYLYPRWRRRSREKFALRTPS